MIPPGLDYQAPRSVADAKLNSMKDICRAAYHEVPRGLEPGLEAVHHYDPPNFTFPFGIYRCEVDIDCGTGETAVQRFSALDDRGPCSNPMIIEGQIHGGLAEGFAVAMGQQMLFDAHGNLIGSTLMDYFLPTAMETRNGRPTAPRCRACTARSAPRVWQSRRTSARSPPSPRWWQTRLRTWV